MPPAENTPSKASNSTAPTESKQTMAPPAPKKTTAPTTTAQPGIELPQPPSETQKGKASIKYEDLLKRSSEELLPPGEQRAEQFRSGRAKSHFTWADDTWEQLGSRPQPHYPQGWTGWSDYKALVAAREKEHRESHPDSKEKTNGTGTETP
ncbi:hypothetical protein F5Y04DRAFT_244673 [Hypomontagnella monticulosa]|nr:hypothetical protein F5Y04DRAFT_244673 [Hypomontagnella monticulosa]